jgi:hypothetical protein
MPTEFWTCSTANYARITRENIACFYLLQPSALSARRSRLAFQLDLTTPVSLAACGTASWAMFVGDRVRWYAIPRLRSDLVEFIGKSDSKRPISAPFAIHVCLMSLSKYVHYGVTERLDSRTHEGWPRAFWLHGNCGFEHFSPE